MIKRKWLPNLKFKSTKINGVIKKKEIQGLHLCDSGSHLTAPLPPTLRLHNILQTELMVIPPSPSPTPPEESETEREGGGEREETWRFDLENPRFSM